MKDFRVSVRLQNNKIIESMEEMRLTMENLLLRMAIKENSYDSREIQGFIDMTISPREREHLYKKVALQLADTLGTTVHDLFGHVIKHEDTSRCTNKDYKYADSGAVINFKRKM